MKYIFIFLSLTLMHSMYGQGYRQFKIGDSICCGSGASRSCGIVFYVENSDSTAYGHQRGLVCAYADQGENIPWRNKKYLEIYAINDYLFARFVADTIRSVQREGNYAAAICDHYSPDSLCTNWYLPSKKELLLMYANIVENPDDNIRRRGNFMKEGYWSSIEAQKTDGKPNKRKAFIVDFYEGRTFPVNKANKYRVRAVREFKNY